MVGVPSKCVALTARPSPTLSVLRQAVATVAPERLIVGGPGSDPPVALFGIISRPSAAAA